MEKRCYNNVKKMSYIKTKNASYNVKH